MELIGSQRPSRLVWNHANPLWVLDYFPMAIHVYPPIIGRSVLVKEFFWLWPFIYFLSRSGLRILFKFFLHHFLNRIITTVYLQQLCAMLREFFLVPLNMLSYLLRKKFSAYIHSYLHIHHKLHFPRHFWAILNAVVKVIFYVSSCSANSKKENWFWHIFFIVQNTFS